MSKEENVFEFYMLCNKLKNVVRSAWTIWNVKRDRLESIAEHVYSVQMLALAMYSEYDYDIDIKKVIYMLAIHEIGETVIGDITQFDMSKEEKEELEHKAVHNILNGLLDGEEIEKIFLEFDSHNTKESLFAFECDKLECDLQAKLYDMEHCVDLNNQEGNKVLYDKTVQKYLSQGDSWSEMWLKFSGEKYPYDENFRKVSNYALTLK